MFRFLCEDWSLSLVQLVENRIRADIRFLSPIWKTALSIARDDVSSLRTTR
jgi:hypothetical protein